MFAELTNHNGGRPVSVSLDHIVSFRPLSGVHDGTALDLTELHTSSGVLLVVRESYGVVRELLGVR